MINNKIEKINYNKDNNYYNYELNNINFVFKLDFDLSYFLKQSKSMQKDFFYDNLNYQIRRAIRKALINIENYAEMQEFKPLIIYLHCLNIDNFTTFKHIFNNRGITLNRNLTNFKLKIPKNVIDYLKEDESNYYFNSEIDLLKNLKERLKNDNN